MKKHIYISVLKINLKFKIAYKIDDQASTHYCVSSVVSIQLSFFLISGSFANNWKSRKIVLWFLGSKIEFERYSLLFWLISEDHNAAPGAMSELCIFHLFCLFNTFVLKTKFWIKWWSFKGKTVINQNDQKTIKTFEFKTLRHLNL